MGTSKSIVKDYAKVCKENTKLIEQVEARDEKIAEVKKELKEEKKKNKVSEKKCEKKDKIIESQKAELKARKKKRRQLERDNKILEERLAQVLDQLNRNSGNSSKSMGINQDNLHSKK